MRHARSDSRAVRHVQLVCSTRSMTRVQRTKYDSRAVTHELRLILRIKLINTCVNGTRECKLSRELYRIKDKLSMQICLTLFNAALASTLNYVYDNVLP